MFRDKWIVLFFKFPPFCGDFSLHLCKMVKRGSPVIKQNRFLFVGIKTEAFWYTVYVDIQTSSGLS